MKGSFFVQIFGRLNQLLQVLQCILEGEGFSFIIGAWRPVVLAYANYFLVSGINNDKAPCTMSISGATIKEDVNGFTMMKPGLEGQAVRLLKGSLRDGHVFYNFHGQFFFFSRLLIHVQAL